MNRLITILIISTLFSQSVWAFHDLELNNIQEQTYTQTSTHSDNENENHDHCSHASAHLIGLISNITIFLHAGTKNNIIILTNTPLSINYQPPVPPPTL